MTVLFTCAVHTNDAISRPGVRILNKAYLKYLNLLSWCCTLFGLPNPIDGVVVCVLVSSVVDHGFESLSD
jgi:hypothetical protein